MGLVLRYLVWDVGTSGMNVECKAATELDWMRNRYVQALDLSPGFSDLGSQGLISEVGLAVWKRGFMRWVERLKQNELGCLLIEIFSYGSDSDILLNRRDIRSKLDILL